jgi:hypothetical protein
LQQVDRGRILKLLGVDVWSTRRDPLVLQEGTVAGEKVGQPSATSPVAEDFSDLTRQLRGELAQPTRRPVATAAAATPAAAAPEVKPVRTGGAGATDLRATRVLSLRTASLLLLVEVQDLKYARRLASDLLLAGAGDWQSRPEQTVFDWHPRQAGSAGVSGLRALAAFIDKQLDDLGSDRGVLVCQQVLDLLPDLADAINRRNHDYVAMPALRELVQDGEAKRTLWRKIQQLKTR